MIVLERGYHVSKKLVVNTNSLASLYPEVAKEWDYERNEGIPEDYTYGSSVKVWWKCKSCGESYQAVISSRTTGGTKGCRKCGRKIAAEKVSAPNPEDSLAAKFPDIAGEWSSRNECGPELVHAKARRSAWWVCSTCAHEWEASIYSRTCAGNGCPACGKEKRKASRRKTALANGGSLADANPESAKCFDMDKNAPATPSTILSSSSDVYYWTCSKCGETFTAKPTNMKNGRTTCSKCGHANAKPRKKGYSIKVKPADGRSLSDLYPDIAAELSERNGVPASQVPAASAKKMWWVCPSGHEYMMTVGNRTTLGQGCPYCSGHKVLAGFNDLATKRPDLIAEWDYESNDVLPTQLSVGSHYKATWICSDCGEKWVASVKSRACNGSGCNACWHKKVGIKNSRPKPGGKLLADAYPDVAAEWDYERNGEHNPHNVAARSGKSFWWICPDCGHSYSSAVYNRTKLSEGCPECAKRRRISFPEKALFYYVSKAFPDAEENKRNAFDGIGRFEVDVWIPSLDTGLEYDGQQWHTNTERDMRKNALFLEAGMRLIRVREPECPVLEDGCEVVVRGDAMSNGSLNVAIREALSMLGVEVDVDVDRDEGEIRALLGDRADNADAQLALDFDDVA